MFNPTFPSMDLWYSYCIPRLMPYAGQCDNSYRSSPIGPANRRDQSQSAILSLESPTLAWDYISIMEKCYRNQPRIREGSFPSCKMVSFPEFHQYVLAFSDAFLRVCYEAIYEVEVWDEQEKMLCILRHPEMKSVVEAL